MAGNANLLSGVAEKNRGTGSISLRLNGRQLAPCQGAENRYVTFLAWLAFTMLDVPCKDQYAGSEPNRAQGTANGD